MSKSIEYGVFCKLTQNIPPPPQPPEIGTSHQGLGNFRPDQQRIPKIGNSHGGFCVLDWCVETTAVSSEDTISFKMVIDSMNVGKTLKACIRIIAQP